MKMTEVQQGYYNQHVRFELQMNCMRVSVSVEEEPMDVSSEYSEGDCQPEGEGLVEGETQQ